jgi:serine/threonine-protein kinase
MTLSEDLTGRGLGKYELRERVGRGGMAEVYKAYHASLDRFVAVKVLHAFLSEDPEFKDRFEREARNIAKLRHNNIVQVYDFEFEPGPDLYYMIMEFVDGPTLRNELLQKESRGERLPLPEVIRIGRDVSNPATSCWTRKINVSC